MDSELLAGMFDVVEEQDLAIDSLTVIRNGYLIADATFFPFRSSSQHIIHSVTKSISAALIGIAIEEGHIEGVRLRKSGHYLTNMRSFKGGDHRCHQQGPRRNIAS